MPADARLIESDVEAYLRRYEDKELLRFVAVGSVDDGKSTLIGRLLLDTGSVYEDQLAAARKATQMQGAEIDLSLLTDGLAAEREQGITIDVAYRYFCTDKRKFIIADTPGHVQYTRNMVTGASTASAALILIDARLGVLQQSRRHAYIASLLGISHLAVCVNKMDLVGYDRAVFARIRSDFGAFTKSLAFAGVTFFPISAIEGENCVTRGTKIGWYDGPTVLEFLETVPVGGNRTRAGFRCAVQTVLRPNLSYRGYAGRISSGVVARGDPVTVLPSGRKSRVAAIDAYGGELAEAFAPQSVVVRLDDEIDVSRGDMLADPACLPRVVRTFDAHLVWTHETPLDPKRTYLLKQTTQLVRVEVDAVHWRKDMDTLEEVPAAALELNDIGRVTLTAHRALFVDSYVENRETGSFILIDTITNNTVAAGMVLADDVGGGAGAGRAPGDELQVAARSQVSGRERRGRFGAGHGIVVAVDTTAGDSEPLAYAIERRVFDSGASAIVVTLRDGVRECASAARLIAGAGLLAVVSVPGARARDPIDGVCGDPRALVVWRGPKSVLPPGRSEGGAAGSEGLPDLVIDSPSLERCADVVVAALRDRGWLG